MAGLDGMKGIGGTTFSSSATPSLRRFNELNGRIDAYAVKFGELVKAQQDKLTPVAKETPDQLKTRARDILRLKVKSVLEDGKPLNPGDIEQRKAVELAKEVLRIQKERAALRAELGDPGAVVTQRGLSHPSAEMEWRAVPGTSNVVSSYKPNPKFVVGSSSIEGSIVGLEVERQHFGTKTLETILPPPPRGAHWKVTSMDPAHPLRFVGVNIVAAELVKNESWGGQHAPVKIVASGS